MGEARGVPEQVVDTDFDIVVESCPGLHIVVGRAAVATGELELVRNVIENKVLEGVEVLDELEVLGVLNELEDVLAVLDEIEMADVLGVLDALDLLDMLGVLDGLDELDVLDVLDVLAAEFVTAFELEDEDDTFELDVEITFVLDVEILAGKPDDAAFVAVAVKVNVEHCNTKHLWL